MEELRALVGIWLGIWCFLVPGTYTSTPPCVLWRRQAIPLRFYASADTEIAFTYAKKCLHEMEKNISQLSLLPPHRKPSLQPLARLGCIKASLQVDQIS